MNLYTIRQQLNLGIPLTSIKLRVVDYSRVSTDHEEQKSSLKNQIAHFDNMIKKNPNWTYVKSYVDEGISGTSDIKRNNFMRMIEEAKQQKFDLIITKEISRFSRNTLDSIKYTRDLLSYGVAVLFVNDNINTALPDSELRLTIMASLAQDEIRRLSERVKFGMNESITKGNILGNNMLYGYRKDQTTGNLIIQKEESEIIKRLFILYTIHKKSLNEIARIFNTENIKTNQNKDWTPTTLSRMIKNIKYKGYYCGKKTEVIDYISKKIKYLPKEEWIVYKNVEKIPPIIDEKLWNKANKRLESKSKKKRQSQEKYPYSSKIYCKKHNTTFHRRKQCKKTKDTTWLCSEYLKKGKNYCDSPNIREEELNFILKDIFSKLKLDLLVVETILLNNYQKEYPASYSEKEILLKEKNILYKKKDRLLELALNNNISKEEFSTKNNDLNKLLESINKQLKEPSKNKVELSEVKDIIRKKINSQSIFHKLQSQLLTKIVATKNSDTINLEIYLKCNTKNLLCTTYKFKRGYNTKGTKKYKVKYQVLCINC